MISSIFRAKRPYDGLWIRGYLCYQGETPYIISNATNKTIFVDANTIGKRLDIKDRNNNYIYEGDIIQLSQRGPKLAIVEWDNEFLCWRFNYDIPSNKQKRILKYKPLIQASKAHLYKIVGNIYDNLELCHSV